MYEICLTLSHFCRSSRLLQELVGEVGGRGERQRGREGSREEEREINIHRISGGDIDIQISQTIVHVSVSKC